MADIVKIVWPVDGVKTGLSDPAYVPEDRSFLAKAQVDAGYDPADVVWTGTDVSILDTSDDGDRTSFARCCASDISVNRKSGLVDAELTIPAGDCGGTETHHSHINPPIVSGGTVKGGCGGCTGREQATEHSDVTVRSIVRPGLALCNVRMKGGSFALCPIYHNGDTQDVSNKNLAGKGWHLRSPGRRNRGSRARTTWSYCPIARARLERTRYRRRRLEARLGTLCRWVLHRTA